MQISTAVAGCGCRGTHVRGYELLLPVSSAMPAILFTKPPSGRWEIGFLSSNILGDVVLTQDMTVS